MTGTHTKPLPIPGAPPIPATNWRFRFRECLVFRLERGKIVEVHDYFDQLGFMAQLGPAP